MVGELVHVVVDALVDCFGGGHVDHGWVLKFILVDIEHEVERTERRDENLMSEVEKGRERVRR
jgi:hypothetical protein